MVSSLIFKSLSHFELVFVYGVKTRYKLHRFICSCPVLLAPLAEETVFPHCIFFFFLCFFFLGPHPRHMEIPRLGVELEL